jgi:menaquinone-dependent protoporphyrinogen oxidase
MAGSILVAHATKYGSTREVAEAVAETLAERGLPVQVRPAAEVDEVGSHAGVVLGGGLYAGRWHRDARRLLRRHREALARLPIAVFAMGPLTSEEKDIAGSRQQLERALSKVPEVTPVSVAIFGGVIDPAKMRFPLKRMPAADARDWDAIRTWAAGLVEKLAVAGVHAPRR